MQLKDIFPTVLHGDAPEYATVCAHTDHLQPTSAPWLEEALDAEVDASTAERLTEFYKALSAAWLPARRFVRQYTVSEERKLLRAVLGQLVAVTHQVEDAPGEEPRTALERLEELTHGRGGELLLLMCQVARRAEVREARKMQAHIEEVAALVVEERVLFRPKAWGLPDDV